MHGQQNIKITLSGPLILISYSIAAGLTTKTSSIQCRIHPLMILAKDSFQMRKKSVIMKHPLTQ